MQHPCQRCGACCARFRVAFHWSETTDFDPSGMPVELTEPLDAHRVSMRGTNCRTPRCIGLLGTIGAEVSCGHYLQRPSPCRDLAAAWEHGEPSPQCERARAAYGLAPLTPADWPAVHMER
ncbi:MAG: zinc/iron-chelating domain-containing protein [Lysobacterales bacterium 69-70]|nr:YkgJ family cysteine cluster protein [Xanthomonadaceae bacterium]ODU31034.1 MAG: ferredoxin [Xanthomonadaceae bacterium SCN 69-320]ODV20803.1 MAG: ferredoxin [Xanthomonadaceae bacterium SCN 69-25]OJY98622.1 MAG: zinc/iron-chelating domain-containing protein [Xanthomonadales bacterium 69-70]